MTFTIYKEKAQDRLVRMGHGSVLLSEIQPPVSNKQGRKKMADEKKLGHETGVKKISQEPADKQGPIGTGGDQHPADPPAGGDVKVGGDDEES